MQRKARHREIVMKLIHCSFVLAALAVAGAAFASDQQHSKTMAQSSTSQSGVNVQGASFERLDTNHDGFISNTEAENGSVAGFDKADSNDDGRLDRNEYGALNSNVTSSETASSAKTGKTASEAAATTGAGTGGGTGSSGTSGGSRAHQ